MLQSHYNIKPMDACWLQENIKCQFTCPVHTNAGGYVSLIAQGKFEDAYMLAAEPNPLVAICGRICAHPCETACRRGQIDEPVAIRALKGFVVEQALQGGKHRLGKPNVPRKEKVAVIGSGPAGLSCAHDLALRHYQVTIYEAQKAAGGMLRLGIPEYRLPREIINSEIEKLLDLGVHLKLGVAAGRDFTLSDLKRDGFKAIFLGVGACRSRDLNITGSNLDGVLKGVDFLLNVNLGYKVDLGQKVIVIGGGNVAIDVARSAARLTSELETETTTALDTARLAMRMGAREVHLVCLESRAEMPASEEEIKEALEEGIILHTSRSPKAIKGELGKTVGLLTQDVVSVFDAQGKFNPTIRPNSDRLLEADSIILAIGQNPDLDFISQEDGIVISPRGTIAVDSDTMATSAPGIFAGGDAAFGPRIAINAIADGRRAAISIHAFLGDDKASSPKPKLLPLPQRPARPLDGDYLQIRRQEVPVLEIDRRVGVTAVELGFDKKTAQREAKRCLQCFFNTVVNTDECLLCGGCVDVCPYDCLKLVSLSRIQGDDSLQREIETRLKLISGQPALSHKAASFTHGDNSVLLKDDELCVRCGLCAERCPSGAMRLVEYVWADEVQQPTSVTRG